MISLFQTKEQPNDKPFLFPDAMNSLTKIAQEKKSSTTIVLNMTASNQFEQTSINSQPGLMPAWSMDLLKKSTIKSDFSEKENLKPQQVICYLLIRLDTTMLEILELKKIWD